MTGCGPGILWSVMPMELVMDGLEAPPPERVELVLDGRVLQVEPGQDGWATLVRLISGQAQDYLDPRFQPGVRLRTSDRHPI